MCRIQAPDCLGLFTALSNSGLPLLCRLFLGTDSSTASSPVRETPRSPPTGSSGESMDSVSVSSSDSSSPSDSEGLTPTHSSDSQQNKVGYYKVNKKRLYSNPHWSLYLFIHSHSSLVKVTLLEVYNKNSCEPCRCHSVVVWYGLVDLYVTSASTLSQLSESSSCTSLHSMDTSSSTASVTMTPVSPSLPGPPCTHRRSVSLTPLTPSSPSQTPAYNTQAQDACIIRVSLEHGNGNLYKSILVRKCRSVYVCFAV